MLVLVFLISHIIIIFIIGFVYREITNSMKLYLISHMAYLTFTNPWYCWKWTL